MFTMTRDQAMEFMAAGARTGKVATASPDGKVHVAPLWFVVDGQDLVFVTTATSVKGRHLHANPLAALCVDDDTYPCAFVTARGTVVLEDAASDLRDWTTRIARRYVPHRTWRPGPRGSPAATCRSARSSTRSATMPPARPWSGCAPSTSSAVARS